MLLKTIHNYAKTCHWHIILNCKNILLKTVGLRGHRNHGCDTGPTVLNPRKLGNGIYT